VTPLWIVLGTLGGVSLGAAHAWVQGQAPDLVPRPWGAWLGALWLAPGPLLGLGISWGPTVWALAMVATGLLAWPMAALVDARRHRLEHLAGVGQREVDARRLLRRPSPPEVTRALTPLGASSLDPERDRQRVTEAWHRVIERRRAAS
jgi:hypothetical protein